MAEKARTPRSGDEREAKYASKMNEKDYETWCAKNREKRRKCIDSMSEQKREDMKRRNRERKWEKKSSLERPDQRPDQGLTLRPTILYSICNKLTLQNKIKIFPGAWSK